MARLSKSKTDSESAPSTSAPVIAAAPVAEKAVKATKTLKPKKEAVAPVDAAAPVAPTPVVVQESSEQVAQVDTSMEQTIAEFLSKIQQMSGMVASLKADFRVLEKKWSRDLKAAQKQSSKRKRKTGTRSPSGFVKPTRISDELATFLEKPSGTEMARTDVTRHINAYIRGNNLQDKANGRKINPDTKLASLLKLSKTDELTYFNLQKYMSPHFAKNVKVEVVTTSTL